MKAVAEGGEKKVCERIAGKGAEGSMWAMSRVSGCCHAMAFQWELWKVLGGWCRHRSLRGSLELFGNTRTARVDDWRNVPSGKSPKTMTGMGGVVTFAGFRVPKRLRTSSPWIVHLDWFVLLKKSVRKTTAVTGVWEGDLLEEVALPVHRCVTKGSLAGREQVNWLVPGILPRVLHRSSPEVGGFGSEIMSSAVRLCVSGSYLRGAPPAFACLHNYGHTALSV